MLKHENSRFLSMPRNTGLILSNISSQMIAADTNLHIYQDFILSSKLLEEILMIIFIYELYSRCVVIIMMAQLLSNMCQPSLQMIHK